MRRNYSFLSLIAAVLFLSSASLGASASLALDTCLAALDAVVSSAYANPRVYHPNYCCKTAAELAKTLEGSGFPLGEVKIIFIVHEVRGIRPVNDKKPRKLTPDKYKNRSFSPQWDYHALVEFRGQIIDLDVSKEPRSPEPYFNELFPNDDPEYNLVESDRLSGIFMRLIPATQYLADYHSGMDEADLRTFSLKYRVEDFPGLPLVSVRDYLSTPR